jgi:hypothetical protein
LIPTAGEKAQIAGPKPGDGSPDPEER